MESWYRRSFWRNLVDMHIPDWNPDFLAQFDSQHYADMLESARVESAILYAGSCLGNCYWPTPVGHMHAGLKGRDIFGETVTCCREKKMDVVGYFNIWNRSEYDRHPEWRMQKANGRFSVWDLPDDVPTRYRVCCPNSEEFTRFVETQVSDLTRRYELDGIWIDMIGWNGTVCYCHNCRERYIRETGEELPETVDWKDPHWASFVRAREQWFVDFQNRVDRAVRSVKPQVSVTFQCGSWAQGWGSGCTPELFSIGDFLAGDFYGDAVEQSVICKTLAAYSRNRPIEFMTSRCANLFYHTTSKTYEELKRAACSAFAHNAAFTFIDAIDPVGTISDPFYRMMGRLDQEIGIVKDALLPDAIPLSDVGLYTNTLSAFDPSQDGKGIRETSSTCSPLTPLMDLGEILLKNHLPFEVVTPTNLEACRRLQLLVLPSVLSLSLKEMDAIRSFVQEGGSLLATGRTSLWNDKGDALPDFALADVLGVHLVGPATDEDITYMSPTAVGLPFLPDNDGIYPMQVGSPQLPLAVDKDCEIVALTVLPYSSSKEADRFGSCISNPPGIRTDQPCIVRRKYGHGTVIYVNAALEKEKIQAQRDVMLRLIRSLLVQPLKIRTNAPSWIEVQVYHDVASDVVQLSLVKTLHEWNEAVSFDVVVDFDVPRPVVGVRDVLGRAEVPFVNGPGRVSVQLPRVDDFTMLVLELEPSSRKG
jgi:hypothetical protein